MQRQPVGALIFALAVAMAPLVFQLPLWTLGWCALSWSYMLIRDRRRWPLPTKGMRFGIFLVGMAVVLLFAGLRFDGGDFIALLAAMAGLKPLEVERRRDSMVTLFLAYFMVITSLFVFENLTMTMYLFASVWVTTGVLIHVNDPNGLLRRQMALSARLLLMAIPLAVALFLLFPRLSGSFWGAPWAGHGRSGFSTTMRIGDVSRLALVDEPAFTVRFDTPPPPLDRLYWRGIVFRRFDGRSWHPAHNRTPRRGAIRGADLSRYTVMIEPHGHRHLFALDLPATVNPVATILVDHTLVTRRPVRQRLQYGATSYLETQPNGTDAPDDDDLHLPAASNPRTVALGRRWALESTSSEAVVNRALDYFRENDFVYTLRPEQVDGDAIDAFLFAGRKGFCEHYAAAFAVLLRAAGVPARIVGGYQGGHWNAFGKFFTVRHSDAHAWCEVWLDRRGWVRVDPTYAVAPERIDEGIERALDQTWMPEFLIRDADSLVGRWTEEMRLAWEAINVQWDMWFMGFSAEDQMAMLAQFGIRAGRVAGWLLVVLLPFLFIAAVVLISRMRRRMAVSPPDEALKIYGRFLRKMARVGLAKAPCQGPLDYAHAVAARYPEMQREVDQIADRYIRLRYGSEVDARSLAGFRRLVGGFVPNRRPEGQWSGG